MCRGVLLMPAMHLAHGYFQRLILANKWRYTAHCAPALFAILDCIANSPSAIRTSPIKIPSLINSNWAERGGNGKNQKPVAASAKARANSLAKKIWTAEFLPPLVLKYGGKLPTPKIFFCNVAAYLCLMDTNTIRMCLNCDKEMKGFRQAK